MHKNEERHVNPTLTTISSGDPVLSKALILHIVQRILTVQSKLVCRLHHLHSVHPWLFYSFCPRTEAQSTLRHMHMHGSTASIQHHHATSRESRDLPWWSWMEAVMNEAPEGSSTLLPSSPLNCNPLPNPIKLALNNVHLIISTVHTPNFPLLTFNSPNQLSPNFHVIICSVCPAHCDVGCVHGSFVGKAATTAERNNSP
jgi:hypothetical protein